MRRTDRQYKASSPASPAVPGRWRVTGAPPAGVAQPGNTRANSLARLRLQHDGC